MTTFVLLVVLLISTNVFLETSGMSIILHESGPDYEPQTTTHYLQGKDVRLMSCSSYSDASKIRIIKSDEKNILDDSKH